MHAVFIAPAPAPWELPIPSPASRQGAWVLRGRALAEPGVPRRGRRPVVADRPALVPAEGAPVRRVPSGGGVREGGGGVDVDGGGPNSTPRKRLLEC
jgi:hypothetical protein